MTDIIEAEAVPTGNVEAPRGRPPPPRPTGLGTRGSSASLS